MDSCNNTQGAGAEAAPFRTIQVHPTRRCNLSCLHCYSSSAPHLKDMLDVKALKKFLEIAYSKGFNNISLSGGEPFLYRDLEELLQFTRSIGYHNTIASNGMLLASERNQQILQYVDLIALSIDGPQPLHDHIRNQQGAFDKMLRGVQVLQNLKKPFGFIHTITQQSWPELLWLAEFTHGLGAGLLQLHPIEMYGRAMLNLQDFAKDDMLLHRAYILANYITAKYAGKMVVQADLLHRDYLAAFPQIVNPFTRQCIAGGRISDVLDTIIVEETGRILPLAYGFNDSYEIGNVNSFDEDTFDRYMSRKTQDIEQLINTTLDKVLGNKESDIVSWNEILIAESFRQPELVFAFEA